MNFEWDKDKAVANYKKYKISFEEATTIFGDPFLLTFPDPYHSEGEERFINLCVSDNLRVLVVVHTERGENIRIISCRKATKSEREVYEEGTF